MSSYMRIRKSIIEENEPIDEIPDSVIGWLSDLYRLKGVPLEYLIPHTDLLPDESIRFFHLDENWIKSMFSGVLSMGIKNDYLKNLEPKIWDMVHEKVQSELIIRSTKEGLLRSDLLQSSEPFRVTGVLIHSGLVHHFPGLEVYGYSQVLKAKSLDKQYYLPLIRQERLTPKIMMLLFIGEVKTVTINSPKESIAIKAPMDYFVQSEKALNGVLDFGSKDTKKLSSVAFVSNLIHNGEFVLFNSENDQ